jgi:hypothetical protein
VIACLQALAEDVIAFDQLLEGRRRKELVLHVGTCFLAFARLGVLGRTKA